MKPMDERQKKLATDNLGLVGAAVRRMRLHYDLDDLYGVGYLGLCKAALHFRPGGVSFSTYASHIIRNDLISYVNKNSPSRRPATVSLDAVGAFVPSGAQAAFFELEDRLAVRSALQNLDRILDADDALLARMMIGGRTVLEMAAVSGLSVSTVRTARQRIRRRVRGYIEGMGDFGAPDGGAPRDARPNGKARRNEEA